MRVRVRVRVFASGVFRVLRRRVSRCVFLNLLIVCASWRLCVLRGVCAVCAVCAVLLLCIGGVSFNLHALFTSLLFSYLKYREYKRMEVWRMEV